MVGLSVGRGFLAFASLGFRLLIRAETKTKKFDFLFASALRFGHNLERVPAAVHADRHELKKARPRTLSLTKNPRVASYEELGPVLVNPLVLIERQATSRMLLLARIFSAPGSSVQKTAASVSPAVARASSSEKISAQVAPCMP